MVTTEVGGLPEVVGDAAILVPANDSVSLAEALIRVLTNRSLAGELREKGLERVRQFDCGNPLKKYEQVYQRIVDANNNSPLPKTD